MGVRRQPAHDHDHAMTPCLRSLWCVLAAALAPSLHAAPSWPLEQLHKDADTVLCTGTVCSIGSTYGGWTYDSAKVSADSVVYSVGIGEDMSWDVGMVKKHACRVFGFDPTAKSVAYVQKANVKGFHHTPTGMADHKGELVFTKPSNPDYVSMKVGEHADGGEQVRIPVNTLANWMRALGHARLEILKIDIEGSEYAVIEHLRKTSYWPFEQFLVEWHFRDLDGGHGSAHSAEHQKALATLAAAGYVQFASKNAGQEVSYKRA